MLRSRCDRFRGQTTSQWNNGAALDSNLSADISCLHQGRNAYGMTVWSGGHRNGQTGVNNPDTSSVNGYKTAVYRIRDQLNGNSANPGNDIRFRVDVRPIRPTVDVGPGIRSGSGSGSGPRADARRPPRRREQVASVIVALMASAAAARAHWPKSKGCAFRSIRAGSSP